MAGNFGGGGDKFRSASQNLERPMVQLGSPQVTQMPIGKDMRGNVTVAMPLPDVAPAVIGKGASGANGQVPLRVVGASPFGHEMGAPAAPMPTQQQFRQPQFAPQAAPPPPQRGPALGENEEVHVLVATLEGPGGQRYEAVYEVQSPRGSRVLGVSERPY